MELVKLNRERKKVEKRFSEEGLKKRREASRKHMILNNPMKREEVRNKVSIKMKGIINNPKNLFKKGNQYGKLRKKRRKLKELKKSKIYEKKKKPIKIDLSGYKIVRRKRDKINMKEYKKNIKKEIIKLVRRRIKPISEEEKINLRKRFLLNNPMKNSEIVKKRLITLRENYQKKNKSRDDMVCYLYKEGLGTRRISKGTKISEATIRNILKRNNIKKRKIKEYKGDLYPKTKEERTAWNKNLNIKTHKRMKEIMNKQLKGGLNE